jgi:hypothetical protein
MRTMSGSVNLSRTSRAIVEKLYITMPSRPDHFHRVLARLFLLLPVIVRVVFPWVWVSEGAVGNQ